uniref:Beta-propeller fold lactonase family protein n=1 Tax=Chryseobacterium endophyticum TaxID=1854762 RepID=A0AAU6WTT3_9FLAO
MKPILFLIIFVISLSKAHAQHTYAFFGSFNRAQDTEGLYVYELDTLSGKLSKVTSFAGILNPSFLIVSPNGKYIFACTESKTKNGGSVSSFAFDPEKSRLRLSVNRKAAAKILFISPSIKTGNGW